MIVGYVWVNGDGGSAGYDAGTLATGPSFGVRDGIISNVRNGQVYLLADALGLPLGFGGGTVSKLVEVGANGTLTGNSIARSFAVSVTGSGSQAGLFSGYDAVLLHDGGTNSNYRVDLTNGAVTSLGTRALSSQPITNENWATWGVYENFGGQDYMSYFATTPVNYSVDRLSVQTGLMSQIFAFANMSQDVNLAVSVAQNSWYAYWEHGAQFPVGEDEGLARGAATFEITADAAAVPEPGSLVLLSLEWSRRSLPDAPGETASLERNPLQIALS